MLFRVLYALNMHMNEKKYHRLTPDPKTINEKLVKIMDQ